MHLRDFIPFRLPVRRIKTSSALHALLALCLIVTPLCIWRASVSIDVQLQVFLLAFGFAPVAALIVAFFIFMFRDPDRLQSEQFQIASHALDFIGDSDLDFHRTTAFLKSVHPMMNPHTQIENQGAKK
jgi:hypothetical protein